VKFPLAVSSASPSSAPPAGIFLDNSTYCDMVAPGGALYGGNPTPGRSHPMSPVVDLQGRRILQVRHVEKGGPWVNSCHLTGKRDSRSAVIAAGSDRRHLRAGSNDRCNATAPARGLVAGKRCPSPAASRWDLMAADVHRTCRSAPCRRDRMATADRRVGSISEECAAHAGTISYEVLDQPGTAFHHAGLEV